MHNGSHWNRSVSNQSRQEEQVHESEVGEVSSLCTHKGCRSSTGIGGGVRCRKGSTACHVGFGFFGTEPVRNPEGDCVCIGSSGICPTHTEHSNKIQFETENQTDYLVSRLQSRRVRKAGTCWPASTMLTVANAVGGPDACGGRLDAPRTVTWNCCAIVESKQASGQDPRC